MANFHGRVLGFCSLLVVGGCVADEARPVPAAPSAAAVQLAAAEVATLTVVDGAPLTGAPGEAVWMEPGPATVDGAGPPDEVAKVCGSLTSYWAAVPVAHQGWLCLPGSACTPITFLMSEGVVCANTCTAPGTYTCTTVGAASHAPHATTMPSTTATTTCETPCGSLSTCSGCT
jgi:hypothetical protein